MDGETLVMALNLITKMPDGAQNAAEEAQEAAADAQEAAGSISVATVDEIKAHLGIS